MSGGTPVAIAQFDPGTDPEANFAAMRELIAQAAAAGARVTVLPEASMLALFEAEPARRERLVREAWRPFRELLAEQARRHGCWLVAGGFEPAEAGRPYNTLLVVDPDGRERAAYRKLHMYDAFAHRESESVAAGQEPAPVLEIEGQRFGFFTCYDLRFPELARDLADRGAEVLVCIAAWVRGPLKEAHWDALTRARAIENTVWLVAAGSSGRECIGDSRIIDPLGVVRTGLGPLASGVAVLETSPQRLAEVRAVLPSLADRRMRARPEISPAGS